MQRASPARRPMPESREGEGISGWRRWTGGSRRRHLLRRWKTHPGKEQPTVAGVKIMSSAGLPQSQDYCRSTTRCCENPYSSRTVKSIAKPKDIIGWTSVTGINHILEVNPALTDSHFLISIPRRILAMSKISTRTGVNLASACPKIWEVHFN